MPAAKLNPLLVYEAVNWFLDSSFAPLSLDVAAEN
jgi:hypothetical protein